jgi:hypothetical protein
MKVEQKMFKINDTSLMFKINGLDTGSQQLKSDEKDLEGNKDESDTKEDMENECSKKKENKRKSDITKKDTSKQTNSLTDNLVFTTIEDMEDDSPKKKSEKDKCLEKFDKKDDNTVKKTNKDKSDESFRSSDFQESINIQPEEANKVEAERQIIEDEDMEIKKKGKEDDTTDKLVSITA